MKAYQGAFRGLWAAIAGMALACGQVQGPEYRGEPLVTITGQLTAEPGTDIGDGIRLAVVWYLGTGDGQLSRPKVIVTEDLLYTGTFPLEYSFGLFKPPPEEAMIHCRLCGGNTLAAQGLLLAYQDRNGNGQLDTITEGGQPVDRVLGASMDIFLEGTGYVLMYLNEPVGPYAEPGFKDLKAGFNLVTRASVVPLSTPVPLKLTSLAELDLLVCDLTFTHKDYIIKSPCGVTVYEPAMEGVLTLSDQGASAHLSVVDTDSPDYGESVHPVDEAWVTVEGVQVPQVGTGVYELETGPGKMLTSGANHVIRVQAPRQRPVTSTVVVPGPFLISSPKPGQVVATGAPLTVSWTGSPGAHKYLITLTAASGETLASTTTSQLTWTTGALAYEGAAVLKLVASTSGGRVTAQLVRTVPLTLAH